MYETIAKTVRDESVDILAVQEIQSDRDPGGDMTLFAFALAKAGWPMPYTMIVDSEGPDDLAIFSRYRIISPQRILEPGPHAPWPRPGLCVDIDAGGQRIRLVNLHLEAAADAVALEKRLRQGKALADFLRSQPDRELVILAGTMNTVAVGDRPRPRNPDRDPGKDLSVEEREKPRTQSSDRSSTLEYLELRDDTDAENDLFAVNEYLLPGRPTYRKGAYRGILDHLILSKTALAYMDRNSLRVLDPGTSEGHVPVLLRLVLPLSR